MIPNMLRSHVDLPRLYIYAAAANVWVLTSVLGAAVALQLAFGELPCRLCLHQRIALMAVALGPLHMLMAARTGHLGARDVAIASGLAIMASLFGVAASSRQVLLHILPGAPGYGMPVLGLHLYTWCLIAFICQIAASATLAIGSAWLDDSAPTPDAPRLAKWAGIGLGSIIVLNIALVFAEAGFHWDIPEDPVRYLLFR
jgi:disulfide bond formation protein DsbB